jgi:hypothetical protein
MQKSASAVIGNGDSLARTIEIRRPPRTAAKVSSGTPSGNGITAASMSAGGPPTITLTKKGFRSSFALE